MIFLNDVPIVTILCCCSIIIKIIKTAGMTMHFGCFYFVFQLFGLDNGSLFGFVGIQQHNLYQLDRRPVAFFDAVDRVVPIEHVEHFSFQVICPHPCFFVVSERFQFFFQVDRFRPFDRAEKSSRFIDNL